MKVWIDAQLSPALAVWMSAELGTDATALRDLKLRDARDAEIFDRARAANAVVLTKDHDFLELLRRRGPPPRILWLTAGNSSNQSVKALLARAWPKV